MYKHADIHRIRLVHTYIFTYSHERSKRPFILELYVCLGFVLVFVLTQEKQKSYYGAPIPATTNTPVMHEHVQLINVLFLGLNLAGSIGRCNCQCCKACSAQMNALYNRKHLSDLSTKIKRFCYILSTNILFKK